MSSLYWRRGWDLNPRILSYRRFSRPVHSAALPPLHCLSIFYLQRITSLYPVGQEKLTSELSFQALPYMGEGHRE